LFIRIEGDFLRIEVPATASLLPVCAEPGRLLRRRST
jgi:hypothetical protein